MLIDQIVPQNDKSDGVCWHGSDYSKFPIKRFLDKLHDSIAPVLPKSISNLIWKIKAAPRAHLVIWLANLEKLKTGYFLAISLGIYGC